MEHVALPVHIGAMTNTDTHEIAPHQDVLFSPWMCASIDDADMPTNHGNGGFHYRGVQWHCSTLAPAVFGTCGDAECPMNYRIEATPIPGRLTWSATHAICDGVWAAISGEAIGFEDAVTAALAIRPESCQFGGLVWHRTGSTANEGWIATIGGLPVEIRATSEGWRWHRDVAQGSVQDKIFRLSHAYPEFVPTSYAGTATTRDEAAEAALAAPDRLATMARQLVADLGFDAGRRAGIEAVLHAADKL